MKQLTASDSKNRNNNNKNYLVEPKALMCGEEIVKCMELIIITWCNAVNPSTLAVSISTPFSINRMISSLSPDKQAAKNTQPDENFTLLDAGSFGVFDARFVSESSHRFSCSARFSTAELLRASNDIFSSFRFIQLLFLLLLLLPLFFSSLFFVLFL